MTKGKVSVLLRKEFFPNDELAKLYTKTSIKTTRKTMVGTHEIPNKIYHFTRKENLEGIVRDGLKAGLDGGVFVSTSLDENLAHLIENVIKVDGFLNPVNQEILPNEEKIEDYVIIEGCPVNSYRKNWLAYLNKSHQNEYTLFYLGDTLELENVKVYAVCDLI